MARPKNPKCVKCSTKSVEYAKSQDCWVGQPCHQKRSKYRNAASWNKARRDAYAQAKDEKNKKQSEVQTLPQPKVELKPYAIIYFNRQSNRADAPIDSIEVKVFQDGKAIAEIEPVTAIGWGAKEVKEYALKCVEIINEAYGIKGFVRQVNRCLDRTYQKFCT